MIKNLKLSLRDIAGSEYTDKVICASAALTGASEEKLRNIAEEKVEFFPEEFAGKLDALIPGTGSIISQPLNASSPGAGSDAFNGAFHNENAPLTGM